MEKKIQVSIKEKALSSAFFLDCRHFLPVTLLLFLHSSFYINSLLCCVVSFANFHSSQFLWHFALFNIITLGKSHQTLTVGQWVDVIFPTPSDTTFDPVPSAVGVQTHADCFGLDSGWPALCFHRPHPPPLRPG